MMRRRLLPQIAPPEQLAAAFGLHRCGSSFRGRCPACGRASAFSCSAGESRTLVHCFAGCSFAELRTALEGAGLADDRTSVDAVARPRVEPKRWSDLAERMWNDARPIGGTLADRYLEHRIGDAWRVIRDGVIDADELRFLPRGDGGEMIARVVDVVTGAPLTIHRTRLGADARKADDGRLARLLLAGHQKAGGCVHLVRRHGDELGVAEGIETALSAIAGGFWPTWSLIDAGNLRALPVLPGISRLAIFADNDVPGIASAEACAARWRAAGRRVAVMVPPEPGTDWNDVLRATGAAA